MDPEDPYSDPDHFQNSIIFEVSVFKNYISWLQKIHIVIRITSKIQPFHPFTFSDISQKCHQNPSISFSATLYTNTSGSLDPDSDPDHSKNLITCSSHHLGHLLKMSSQSIHNFLRYLSLKITFHGSRRSI